MFARDYFAAKTNLAVSSMEYCGCLHCERDVREALSGGCGNPHPIPNLGGLSEKRRARRFCSESKIGIDAPVFRIGSSSLDSSSSEDENSWYKPFLQSLNVHVFIELQHYQQTRKHSWTKDPIISHEYCS